MGQATLVARLAASDLRRHRIEFVLLLLTITAATTTLTLGLTVRGLVSNPYETTRAVTSGPDVVATIAWPPGEARDQPTDVSVLEELIIADGVVGHSGPFPVIGADMEANGETVDVQVVGRDSEPSTVDQPQVTQGSWVKEGGIVVEAAFAAAKDLEVGDQVTMSGEPFRIVGIAVTAASAPFPKATCLYVGCITGASPEDLSELDLPPWALRDPGLVWVTRTDAEGLSSEPDPTAYVLNLHLEDPNQAEAFAKEHESSSPSGPGLIPWQEILEESSHMVRDAEIVLFFGSGLLILMAMATVAVLVGGRMADQHRRCRPPQCGRCYPRPGRGSAPRRARRGGSPRRRSWAWDGLAGRTATR